MLIISSTLILHSHDCVHDLNGVARCAAAANPCRSHYRSGYATQHECDRVMGWLIEKGQLGAHDRIR